MEGALGAGESEGGGQPFLHCDSDDLPEESVLSAARSSVKESGSASKHSLCASQDEIKTDSSADGKYREAKKETSSAKFISFPKGIISNKPLSVSRRL
jgi:hypothetical protein